MSQEKRIIQTAQTISGVSKTDVKADPNRDVFRVNHQMKNAANVTYKITALELRMNNRDYQLRELMEMRIENFLEESAASVS